LENLIERAAILSATGEISPEDIENCREPALPATGVISPVISTPAMSVTLKEAEREQIIRAVRESAGNRSQAARKLGIERKLLYKKARRMGIDLDAIDK
jgi:DNA-binding NtrC family response regulator